MKGNQPPPPGRVPLAISITGTVIAPSSEAVYRNFQIVIAIIFCRRKLTGTKVHLYDMQHAIWKRERFIPLLSHLYIVRLLHPADNMHIMLALLGNTRLPRRN